MSAALGLLGETSRFTNFIVDTVSSLGSTETSDTVRALFEALAKAPAGYAFALGLLLTLWSASGYVSAFGRAMNRIYGFREGRIAWKLRLSFVPLGALLVLLTGRIWGAVLTHVIYNVSYLVLVVVGTTLA